MSTHDAVQPRFHPLGLSLFDTTLHEARLEIAGLLDELSARPRPAGAIMRHRGLVDRVVSCWEFVNGIKFDLENAAHREESWQIYITLAVLCREYRAEQSQARTCV